MVKLDGPLWTGETIRHW